MQENYFEVNPEELFALITSLESILLLLSQKASEDLDAERCDADNAYLVGDLDIPIRMKKPTNSSMDGEKLGYGVLLIKSLNGAY